MKDCMVEGCSKGILCTELQLQLLPKTLTNKPKSVLFTVPLPFRSAAHPEHELPNAPTKIPKSVLFTIRSPFRSPVQIGVRGGTRLMAPNIDP